MSTNNNALTGGWTAFNFDLSADDKKILDTATRSRIGVKYTALAVAKQVVAGTNYSFLAKGDIAVPGTPTIVVLININVPLDGQEYRILQIVPVTP